MLCVIDSDFCFWDPNKYSTMLHSTKKKIPKYFSQLIANTKYFRHSMYIFSKYFFPKYYLARQHILSKLWRNPLTIIFPHFQFVLIGCFWIFQLNDVWPSYQSNFFSKIAPWVIPLVQVIINYFNLFHN